jgi:anaerobic magnesium-protoporphyrin IX monomethyl ester cyclase
MKTLLIRPPAKFIEGAIKPSISLPTGLLYLAAVLEQSRHTVSIYDAQLSRDRPVSPNSDGTLHMGDSWETISQRISQERPQIIGISCMFSAQMEYALHLAELVKSIDNNIITVIGGSHATARPHDFFDKTRAIDIACLGEGEFTLREIVERLEAGLDMSTIAGIAVRDGETLRINTQRPRNTDLDSIPFPAYHLIDLENYFRLYARGYTDRPIPKTEGFERSVSVITSRGCPYKCIFCSVHLHMGRSWRPHSVPYVKRHLELLISQYGVRHIHFEDDNISLHTERFRGILEVLSSAKPGLTWDTPNGLRVDTLSKDILLQCRDSGCIYLIFGVESGNQTVLNNIVDKHLDLETVTRASSWANKIGINVMAFYVIGFPGESPAQMMDTVHFALRLQGEYGVTPHLFVATPIPGTRLEQECIERGFIPESLSPQDLAKMTQGSLCINMDSFSKEDIGLALQAFYKGYRFNVIKQGVKLIIMNPHGIIRFIGQIMASWKTLPFTESVIRAIQLGRWIMRNPVPR